MKRLLRRPRMVGVVLLATLLAAGCASGQASAGGTLPPEKTNLVAAVVPALDSAGVYIAQQRGLFAAAGLHVKIVPAISGETAIADQLSGKYDVTLGNYVSYIQHNAQDHSDLRVLAAASIMAPNTQEILVPDNSKIYNIQQLAGKRIGVNVLSNIGTLLISSMLNDNGMTVAGSGVKFVPIPFPLMIKALQKHSIDAAWMPEPFITLAEMQIGARVVADLDQGSTENLPIAGYIVTQRWLNKYPRTAAAFKRAVLEGQAIADRNLTAVKSGVVAFANVPNPVAQIVTADQYPTVTDPRVIQRVANLMLNYQLLHQSYNVKQMIP